MTEGDVVNYNFKKNYIQYNFGYTSKVWMIDEKLYR